LRSGIRPAGSNPRTAPSTVGPLPGICAQTAAGDFVFSDYIANYDRLKKLLASHGIASIDDGLFN